MNQPFVSVIVTTKNNHPTLNACLKSITTQTYQNMELIVVDNSSTDDTVDIARQYTSLIFTYGPERSAQRNYAAHHAKGNYLLIIDSDMELGGEVVDACVQQVLGSPDTKAVIIPEESFGKGFWARCKNLERSFYVGVDAIEAARFIKADVFRQVGGFNEELTGGEDWDLTWRLREQGQVARVQEYIRHNEGHVRFKTSARKMYYYGRHAAAYFAANPTTSVVRNASGPFARYKLFFSRPRALFRHPLVAAGMLVFKAAEYAAAGVGYWRAKSMPLENVHE
ncbi:MAG TPA: glycosyltransferase [Candidatus Saccharimonadia bacterium]|nr:glycosyltransferase [Candidatus Saccharimonadia bacterium]